MLVQVHQHMANRLEGCDAVTSELNIGGQDIKADGTSVSLLNVCDALHKAAEEHDASGALNLLEKLSYVTENSFSGEQCVDSVVAACDASSSVLEAKFGAQVSLKALQSMADLLHLFKEHNQSEDEPCQCPKRIDVVPMTKQILAVLGNSDPYLQAAGLEALQSIAEYLSDSQCEWPAEDAFGAVGDLGVIESTISVLKLLVSWDTHDSDRKENIQLPSRVDLISKAFETLHFLCSQHSKNLCRLAAADGVPTLVSAAEVSLHPAYLLLLAQLALLDGVHSQYIQLCINVVLGSLNSKVEQLQCAALMALHQLHGDVAKPSVEAEIDMLEQLLVQLLKQPRGASSVAVQVHGLGLLARLAPSLPFAKQQLLITCMLMAVGNLCTQLSQTPNTVSVAPSMLASSTSLPIKVSKVQWKDVCNALISVMKFLSTAGSAGLNSTDDEGHTLLHRVAASGFSKALELVLSPPGMPAPDLLVRTREGDNALQLALRSGASECVALLEGATQAAAAQGIQHGVGSLAEGGRDAVPSQDQQELLLASPFASQSLSEGVPLSSQASCTYALGGASVSAAGVDTVSAAGEDAMNMYTRAVEARRAELEQHAAAAQRAQQAAQSAPPCGGSHTRQLSDGKLSADSSRPHPPHSPQPQEGGPMLSAFAETGTAAPHQTAFSISGLDLSQAVGAGLSPSVAPPPLPAGIPLDQPSMQHPHPTPPQGSPHLTGISAFAAAQGGPAFDSPHATPTVAPPLSLSGTTPSILSFPGDAAMHRGSSLSSQLQDSLFIYPQDGPGSPLPNGSMCSSLAVAAAAAQLQRAASATSAAAARIPLQQAGRAGSAASEILQLLPSTAAGQESAAELALGMQAMGGLAGAVADEPEAGSCGDKAKDMDSDVSGEPTRHLWIGNLGTRTPRTVLKTFFDKFGTVDDVVTFPGRMYAFVNYRTLEESMAAFAAMQSQVVPELTGERPLLLKYRPAKKAAAHLRALGLAIEDGNGAGGEGPKAGTSAPEGVAGPGATQGEAVDKDGNSLDPSPRIWLGNIAPTATSKSLHTVLSRFGILNDAAVFPARIGPLGYAFVKFERLEDAIQAFDTLNNTVVPPLSGSKQLKMRYKPPSEGPAGKDDVLEGAKLMVPSRHLWLGNVTQKPSDEAVLEVFSAFGKVDSVRVFPVKAYAFVNYAEIACAIKAMTALEGVAIPSLTGVKPLVMRYQQEAVVAAATAAAAPKPGAAPLPPGMEGMGGLAGEAAPTSHLGVASGLLPEDVAQAVPNLSNMLNPNNLHFDPVLAERYKALSRREKDLLWAKDQLMMAHQLAAAQQAAASGATPADLHMMMRGMNRSHSWNISMLHNHLTQHPNQPASGLSPALTAAAALAALQQQQHAQQAEQQRQLAALQLLNNPGEVQGGGVSRQSSQSLGTVTPQQAQQVLSMQSSRTLTPKPQHPSAPPTSTSASPAQLSAVLSNLAALQSMHSAQEAAGAGRVQPHLEAGLPASMQRAASLPHPRVHSHPPGAPFSGLDAGVLLDTYLGRGSGEGGEQQHHQQQQLDVLSGLVPPPSPPQGSLSGSLDISDFLAKQGLTGGAPASSPRGADGMASALARYGSGNQTPSLSSSAFSPVNLPALSAPAASPAMSSAGSWAAQHIPQHLLCPLSGQVMLDPVVAADGVTYERKAISDWMALRGTSPTTGAPLLHKMLTPSMPTKAALMDYLQRSQLGGGL